MKFYPAFIATISLITCSVFATNQLKIPFKDDHYSKFNFHLEMFDDKTLLDCTGELLIRNVTENIVVNFRNVKVHRTINLQKRAVKAATSLPIILPVTQNEILDPYDYNEWDWIDPRILVKVLKYTALDDNDQISEKGWEVDDKHCKAEVNSSDFDFKTKQVELRYRLKDCVPWEAGETLEEHFRTIKLNVDRENNSIKVIEYFYEKSTKEFDQQNNAEIHFVGFEEY